MSLKMNCKLLTFHGCFRFHHCFLVAGEVRVHTLVVLLANGRENFLMTDSCERCDRGLSEVEV